MAADELGQVALTVGLVGVVDRDRAGAVRVLGQRVQLLVGEPAQEGTHLLQQLGGVLRPVVGVGGRGPADQVGDRVGDGRGQVADVRGAAVHVVVGHPQGVAAREGLGAGEQVAIARSITVPAQGECFEISSTATPSAGQPAGRALWSRLCLTLGPVHELTAVAPAMAPQPEPSFTIVGWSMHRIIWLRGP